MSAAIAQPLRVSAYTASCATGRGRAAILAALRERRGGLRANDFGATPVPSWIGRVEGVEEEPLPEAFVQWECRNNRLAWLGLQQDEFLSAVARERAPWAGAGCGALRYLHIEYRCHGRSLPAPRSGWRISRRPTPSHRAYPAFHRAFRAACLGLDGILGHGGNSLLFQRKGIRASAAHDSGWCCRRRRGGRRGLFVR